MKILGSGCRVFDREEGVLTQLGTWTQRARINRASGATKITHALNEYAPGKSPAVRNPQAEEVLYAVSGSGTCWIDGVAYAVEQGTGVYVPAGSEYVIENPGSEKLIIASACCPEDHSRTISEHPSTPPATADAGSKPVRTVREEERESLPATAGRHFRLLVDKEIGCQQVTQFVGWIPPSTAPFHHHTYEEAVFILEGTGIVHAGEDSHPFGPGSSIFLPALLSHCLENPGTEPVRVMGVFYPSGSPAAAYKS